VIIILINYSFEKISAIHSEIIFAAAVFFFRPLRTPSDTLILSTFAIIDPSSDFSTRIFRLYFGLAAFSSFKRAISALRKIRYSGVNLTRGLYLRILPLITTNYLIRSTSAGTIANPGVIKSASLIYARSNLCVGILQPIIGTILS
jgi:hypothetical protein